MQKVKLYEYEYRTAAEGGKRTTVREVVYPDDHRLSYEPNQNTLKVLDASGQPVAIFRGMQSYVLDGPVVVGDRTDVE